MNFKSINENKLLLILGVLVFVFMYIFFTNVQTLVIYDADDWTYISEPRQFIPIWGAWNPAKLFPETLMPICGSIAAYVIFPITNNYIDSFTVITAFIVSITISIYMYTFARMISKRFELKISSTVAITVLFLLSHFLLFIASTENNQYMFLTHNVNCYYNYLIPNLLNFIIVFIMMRDKKFNYSLSRKNLLKTGVFLLSIYVCIFSNLYCNIILAVYSGSKILINYFNKSNKKYKIKEFVKNNSMLFLIIILWIISAIFELSGGRAESSYNGEYMLLFVKSIKNLGWSLFYYTNKELLSSFVIVLVLFVVKSIINKRKSKLNNEYATLFIKMLICSFVIAIYYILLSAKVNVDYMLKAEYMYGLWAYGLIFIFMCLSYLVKEYPKIMIAFPILICYLIVFFNCSIKTFKQSNSENIDPIICKKIDEDIIEQIINSDSEGLTTIKVYVPKNNTKDNWPHANYLGKRIANTLYRHHIVKNKMSIEIVPDSSYNEKYNLK